MKYLSFCLFLLLFSNSSGWCAAEYVTLLKVLENDDMGIIERRSGERWIIEKGIGAPSFWLFEGKQIIIYSPGLFCGVGSKVILPEVGQEAKIWNAKPLTDNQNPSKIYSVSERELITSALIFLGYFDPLSKDINKSDIVKALKAFQRSSGLPVTGEISPAVLIALSKAVVEKVPTTDASMLLAFSLIRSANNLLNKMSVAPSEIGMEYQGIGITHWIKKNIDYGRYIMLEDGSLWEIDPLERINTMLWLPISNIIIIKSSAGSIGYDYLLINTDDGEKANAKYIGK